MNIVGISAYYHDSAACLLRDGRLIAAAQEERFTRKRHDARFPKLALEYCLASGGIKLEEVNALAFYEKPFLKFERILETLIDDAPKTYLLATKALPIWLKEKLWTRKLFKRELHRDIPLIFCGHHEAHAASAFFPSPFTEAATLTVDGVGEWSTTTWGIGRANSLELKQEIRYPHSLGLLYSAVTQYLGFKVNSAEYKVMGLAPYGEPKYVDLIKSNFIELFPDGSFILNMDYFNYSKKREMIHPRFEELFGKKKREPETTLEPFHADVARSLQVVTEEAMLGISRYVHKQTKLPNLCLAGGVALNCVANGRILSEGPFKNIWIQPGAGDSGGAVGAAYVAWHHVEKKERMPSIGDLQQYSFLGPQFKDSEIESTFNDMGLKFTKLSEENLIERSATLLKDQKILGWFQGRMEFGPRSLGNRSILGDARNSEMQKRMNLKIKFRESFRPFAPSVLMEDAKEYFNLDAVSPYMLLTCQVNDQVSLYRRKASGSNRWLNEILEEVPGRIPAVTHVDGSARVHTVEHRMNPLFYELLRSFKQKTGSPVLINTSFNVRGEPIVCTPKDAIRCFVKSDIDALAIGNLLSLREDQPKAHLAKLREAFSKEDQFELD